MQRAELASVECFLRWHSADAVHTDHQYFGKIDLARDVLPGRLTEQLVGKGPGIGAEVKLGPGESIPARDAASARALERAAVRASFDARRMPGPYRGRSYPRGLLAGVDGLGDVSRQDRRPFRVASIDGAHIYVDLSHPLSGYRLTVGARIDGILEAGEEYGDHRNDIVAEIAEWGAGMQCPPPRGSVDFIYEHALDRMDPGADAAFYRSPRLVHHIDARARTVVNAIYRRFIASEMRVLDLMSSWVSHLDGVAASAQVTGLGMNAEELEANPRLAAYRVQDLNEEPRLPFADASFDTVICTVSVEYLVRPFEVFAEVARVLKPGGHFVVTFSDRWFPPKAIRLWLELHPFERMGLVLDYLRRSGWFHALATESCHGWPRPEDDKYFPQRRLSDTVYAVWGRRAPRDQDATAIGGLSA